MKNIQNIAIATIIVFFSVSCKKEASVETKEVTKAKTEIAAKNLETAIEGRLIETEGVQEAVVDFESKIATVSFDKTKQNINTISTTIEKVAGGDAYKVSKSEIQTVK